jgi:hypothetical protein
MPAQTDRFPFIAPVSGLTQADVAAAATLTFTGGTAPADAATVTLRDRSGFTRVFEFDTAALASGIVTPAGGLAAGEYAVIGDGTNSLTFEFVERATGSIELTGTPNDGAALTIDDGTTSVTFEFDTAARATGSLTFTGQPADGEIVTINDGTATVVFEFENATRATGSVKIDTNPADADTLTIDDGTTTVVFEFDTGDGVAPGHVAVTIGVAETNTRDNLKTAIDGTALDLTTANNGAVQIDLTANEYGTDYNNAITTSAPAKFTLVGLAGGTAEGVTGGRTAVAVGGTADETRDNLLDAIDASVLNLTPTESGLLVINLTAGNYGTGFNNLITTTAANITPAGLSGGQAISVGVGNTALWTDGGATSSAERLKDAINASALGFTATRLLDVVNLVADTYGTDYNGAITEDADPGNDITVTDTSGGADRAVSGSTPVIIQGSVANACANLATAINNSVLAITATNHGGTHVDLLADDPGTTYNVTITKSGAHLTVSGMSGGANSSLAGGTNTVVLVEASATKCRDNLITAINASGLTFTATDSTGGGDPQVTVTDNYLGVQGNGANYVATAGTTPPTAVSFSGGLDADRRACPLIFYVPERGGRINATFEAADDAVTVTLQVSQDGITYSNTTAPNNVSAVVSQTIPARTRWSFPLLLREGKDKYLRLVATGPGIGCLEIEHNGIVEPLRMA